MWFDAVSIFHSCLIYHQVWTHYRLLQPEGLLCGSLSVRTLEPHSAFTKSTNITKICCNYRWKSGKIKRVSHIENKRLAQHLKYDKQAGRVSINKTCTHKQTSVPVTDCKFRLTCKCWICFQSEAHFACQSDGHTQTFNICPHDLFLLQSSCKISSSQKCDTLLKIGEILCVNIQTLQLQGQCLHLLNCRLTQKQEAFLKHTLYCTVWYIIDKR